jgi:hypothetical protein
MKQVTPKNSSSGDWLLGLTLGYTVAFLLCPSRQSFNVRERMKNAIGESRYFDQSKKSLFQRSSDALVRVMAGEFLSLAAGPVNMYSLLGVAVLVDVPIQGENFLWIGCLGHWVFLGCFK